MARTEKRGKKMALFMLVSGALLVAAALHSGYVLGVHFDETGTSGFLTSAVIAALVIGAVQTVTGIASLLSSPKAAST